ncbi:MAG TPA: helix-turn-helix transcriptional regulator [Myxococcota bacterium]
MEAEVQSENENDYQPNRVREIRENRLMTQAQLARKAKVALRTIHSVEKGMNCRMDTKRKILIALGMRFEDKEFVFPSLHRRGLENLPPMPPESGNGGFSH